MLGDCFFSIKLLLLASSSSGLINEHDIKWQICWIMLMQRINALFSINIRTRFFGHLRVNSMSLYIIHVQFGVRLVLPFTLPMMRLIFLIQPPSALRFSWHRLYGWRRHPIVRLERNFCSFHTLWRINLFIFYSLLNWIRICSTAAFHMRAQFSADHLICAKVACIFLAAFPLFLALCVPSAAHIHGSWAHSKLVACRTIINSWYFIIVINGAQSAGGVAAVAAASGFGDKFNRDGVNCSSPGK